MKGKETGTGRTGVLLAAAVAVLCLVACFALVASSGPSDSDAQNAEGVTVLQGDQTISVGYVIQQGSSFTLDLNGHTLTMSGTDTVFLVHGTLIIKDSIGGGSVKGASSGSGVVIDAEYGSHVNVEGGSLVGQGKDGTVCLRSGSELTIDGGTVHGVKADYGGSIYVSRNALLTMNGGTVTGGVAYAGGNIHVSDGGRFVMNGGTVSNGHGVQNGGGGADGTIDGSGGNVYVGDGAEFTMNGGLITGGRVNYHGGSVQVYKNGTFTMNGGTISDSLSKARGGLVSVYGTFVLNDGKLTGGTAYDYGGAVYVVGDSSVKGSSAWMRMNGGTVSNSTAYYGGGICVMYDSSHSASGTNRGYLTGAGYLEVKGGTVSGNTAAKDGGGVYGFNLSMDSMTVKGNTAKYGGGIAASLPSGSTSADPFAITSSVISDNTATSRGGGIYVQCNVSDSVLKDTTVSGNTAQQGGGVYMAQGRLTLDGSHIDGNRGNSDGGGLYLDDDWGSASQLYILSGTISGNRSANDGGGVYNNHAAVYMTGGTISGNHAVRYGGGMHIDSRSGTYLYMTGGSITGNTSDVREAAGLYLGAGSKIIYLHGSPQIYGNGTAGDMNYGLYLTSGNYPHIDGYMNSDAKVEVTMANYGKCVFEVEEKQFMDSALAAFYSHLGYKLEKNGDWKAKVSA